jgi:uncharacterized protein YndB with AHSA1/START domain
MSYLVRHEEALPASRAAAYAALIDPAALAAWFAQHVRVEPSIGGAYAFWGKHSLDGAGSGAGQQRITALEPETMLAYVWTIEHVPTTVTMTLRHTDEGCRIAVEHEIERSFGWPREVHGLEDWWRLCVANLATHLNQGPGLVRPDFSDPAPEVRQVVDIAAPPSVVFRALTDPALVNQWFGSKSAIVEPHVGGRYSVGWKYQVDGHDVAGGPTRILAYEQDRLLTLDWPDWRGDASNGGQRITFTLDATDDGTRLTFVHDGFSRAVDISDFGFGWTWFLGQLREVAMGGVSSADAAS